jgi:hypothetical protein
MDFSDYLCLRCSFVFLDGPNREKQDDDSEHFPSSRPLPLSPGFILDDPTGWWVVFA